MATMEIDIDVFENVLSIARSCNRLVRMHGAGPDQDAVTHAATVKRYELNLAIISQAQDLLMGALRAINEEKRRSEREESARGQIAINREQGLAERLTIISEEKGPYFRCPFPVATEKEGVIVHCAADTCMAWIKELDDKGRTTGRGRCGMVAATLQRTLSA